MKNKEIKKLTNDQLKNQINLIKKDLFNLRFKKINGQWQLKEMEMRNEQTDTRTSIIFDLKSHPEKNASPKK